MSKGNFIMNKKTLKWSLSIIIGLLIIAILLSIIDLKELKKIIFRANIWLLIVACFINVMVMIIKGVRWKILLSSHQNVSLFQSIGLTIVGFFGNTFLPARGGDIGRAIFLAKDKSISKTYCITTVTLDKAIDFFCILLIVIPSSFFFPIPILLKNTVLICSIIGVIFFVILYIYARKSNTVQIDQTSNSFKRILGNIRLGIYSVRSPLLMLKLCLVSVASWIFQTYILILVMSSIGGNLLSFPKSIMTLLGQNIAVAIPGTPSDVGTLHASIVFILYIFGYDKETGMAVAVLYHLILIIPLIILGPVLTYFFSQRMLKESRK
jgi:glycosyltransferase 2 family protein